MSSEERHRRFKRLATQRTRNTLKAIRVLGNCSNRSNYDYTQDEVRKIFREIETALQDTKAKFTYPRNNDFSL